MLKKKRRKNENKIPIIRTYFIYTNTHSKTTTKLGVRKKKRLLASAIGYRMINRTHIIKTIQEWSVQ